MAVINVLPSDGKVIDEGPVGCSADVCCDDFRHLDVGLPPEILRLMDAGYLTQAVAACDRLLEQNPEPSLAACVRAERYRDRKSTRLNSSQIGRASCRERV